VVSAKRYNCDHTESVGVAYFIQMLLNLALLLFLYLLACNTLPCTHFEETDRAFRQSTLVDLYLKPSTFFNAEGVKRCGLQYIDFFNIQPPLGKKNLFVAYLGDSLAKELFVATAQRFSGYIPDDISEVALTLKGAHLGPAEPSAIPETAAYDYTKAPPNSKARFEIHEQYLLCCRANFHPIGLRQKDDGDCILALKRTPIMDDQAASHHHLYIFDHMSNYIRDFVSPLFLDQFKCLGFMTANNWAEAGYVMKDFVDNDGISLLYPSAVIVNVGLHTFYDDLVVYSKHFDGFVKMTNSGKAPIKYILHSTTAVRENNCELYNCSMALIREYNSVIATLASKSLHKMATYLDFYDYSASLQDLKPNKNSCRKIRADRCNCKRPDGVHFERMCNYGPVITQWDFNWMLSLGIFSYVPATTRGSERRLRQR
jgi:hypothetical protein